MSDTAAIPANLTVAWGNVNPDGTLEDSSGNILEVVKEATGTYLVKFSEHVFRGRPAFTVTQLHRQWNEFDFGDTYTTDNAVLVALSRTAAKVKTGDSGSKLQDRRFSFIAIGPAS